MLKNTQISHRDINSYKNFLNSGIKKAKCLYYYKNSLRFNDSVRDTRKFVNEILDEKKKILLTQS